MRHFDTTIDIAAPIATVFDVMTDHERYVAWTAARRVTLEREGREHRNGTGCVRVFHTGVVKVREEVTAYEPPSHMAYRLASGVPVRRYESTMDLDALEPSSTRLRWHGEVEARIPGTEAMLASTFAKAVERFAAGIKEAAEAEGGAAEAAAHGGSAG